MTEVPLRFQLRRTGIRALLLGIVLTPVALVFGGAGTGLSASGGSCGLTGTTWSCTYSGGDTSGTFTVPSNVSSLTVDLISAGGGAGKDGKSEGGNAQEPCFNIPGSAGAAGGNAAEVKGSITVTPGDTLTVVAGSQTHALHGGAGGQANSINLHSDDCPPTDLFKAGGNGGAGGGASYVSAVVNGNTSYLAVAGGGGGGGGGGENPYGCSPGSVGGNHDANGQGQILFHCTGDVVSSGGGTVAANSDGTGGDGGSHPSFAGPLSGAGGGGGGGITGGGGGVVGATDGGAGGAGGQSKVPSGGTSSTVSGSPTPQVVIRYTDTSAPTTTFHLSALGSNGWFASPVSVLISVSDPDDVNPLTANSFTTRCLLDPASVPATFDAMPSGCSIPPVGTDGQHTVYAASKDLAGNKESVKSVSFKVDRTAPTTSFTFSPSSPNGSNGWYTTPVVASAAAAGGTGSGVLHSYCMLDQSPPPTVYLQLLQGPCNGQTAFTDGHHSFYAASEDLAGNDELVKHADFKIDQVPPTDAPLLSGSIGTNGWYTSDVSLAWFWSDGLSGVDANNCTPGGTTSGEGTALTVSGSCHDLAGNTSSDSKTFKVDKTAPTVSAAATSPPNGANNWYTSNVTVHFTCGDNLSGIPAGTCPADQTLSSEGSAVSSTAQTVNDNAGNTSAQSNVVTVKIDKTPPSVAVTGVSDGAQYTYGNVPAAGCSTTDSVSGVATSASVSITGGSNGAGSFTATCSGAVDKAGNQAAPVSVNYTVVYAFGGFITPPPKNTLAYKPGATTPVTFVLTSATGQPISTAVASTLSGKLSVTLSGQGITPVAATCNWNFVLSFFQCNLKIPTLSQIGSSNPYQITAYENLAGGQVTVPPYTALPADANPETVYFK